MSHPKATAKVVHLALTTTVILTGFQLSPMQPSQMQPNRLQPSPMRLNLMRLHQSPLNQSLLSLFPSEAIAHTVKTAEDVGATIHIEPNDTPRAGETSLAWFALTRRGGEPIPLADCSCELAIYALPRQNGDVPLLSPPLISVNAENYQDIPGANITFPNVGAYRLVLSGQPQATKLKASELEDFAPFELDFEVTVAAGQSVPDSTDESAQPIAAEGSDSQSPNPEGSKPSVANRGIAITRFMAILSGLIGLMKLLDMWRSRQKS